VPGGLNILPQKSWNVYNRSNRQRVARDEQAAADAADAAMHEERAARMEEFLAESRGGQGAVGLPLRNINFFEAEERAQGDAYAERERRLKESKWVARVMPHLQLDKSVGEARPWYLQRREADPEPPPSSASIALHGCKPALIAGGAGHSTVAGAAGAGAAGAVAASGKQLQEALGQLVEGSERAAERLRRLERQCAKEGRVGEKRKKREGSKHGEGSSHRERSHREKKSERRKERRHSSRGPQKQSEPQGGDAERLARLRHERASREHSERERARLLEARRGNASFGAGGSKSRWDEGALKYKFMEMAGVNASKPRLPRARLK